MASQRYHWYAVAPVVVPVRRCPTLMVPVIAGRVLAPAPGVVVVVVVVEVVVTGGEPPATRPVGMLSTTCDAVPTVAWRRATSVWPTSAEAGTYDDAAAAAIATHARRVVLQRNHEYVTAVGVFVQTPAVESSVAPTVAVPLMNGRPMSASADAAAIGPMRPASETTEPDAFFAVTTSPSVLPTSAGVRDRSAASHRRPARNHCLLRHSDPSDTCRRWFPCPSTSRSSR